MAQRRMLSKSVTDSDKFINLSASAQALYLHLVMSADDDGFTNQIQMCLFKAHATSQDYEALKDSSFIIELPDGVIVITHWLQQNQIQPSKKVPTVFKDDLKFLELDESKKYSLPEKVRTISGKSPTQYSIGKYSLVKDSKEKDILSGNPDSSPLNLPEKSQKSEKKKQSYSSEVNEIIDYLNQQTGRNYRNVSSNTRLIEARLKEGYTVQDFKTVIDKKCFEWLRDPEMKQYLRPETLFSPKHFESYLNQSEALADHHGNVSVRVPDWYEKESPEENKPVSSETLSRIKKLQEKMKIGEN